MTRLLQRLARLLGFELLTAAQAREIRTALVCLDDGFNPALMPELYDAQAVNCAHKALSNVLRHDVPDGPAELDRVEDWMYPGRRTARGSDDLPF